MRAPLGFVTVGDLYGRGPTTTDLTNPVMDQDRNGEVDDAQQNQAPFPRAVVAILALFGALVVVKFIAEKFS